MWPGIARVEDHRLCILFTRQPFFQICGVRQYGILKGSRLVIRSRLQRIGMYFVEARRVNRGQLTASRR